MSASFVTCVSMPATDALPPDTPPSAEVDSETLRANMRCRSFWMALDASSWVEARTCDTGAVTLAEGNGPCGCSALSGSPGST